MSSSKLRTLPGWPLLLVLAMVLLPFAAPWFGGEYYVSFITRMMIVMVAAMSLNFLIGQAGLVALGHAGFIGVGGYLAAMSVDAGITSAWWVMLWALAGGAVAALVIGAISLRTRGVYFIMITLAFAQMLYYIAVSLQRYGGDEGYTLPLRPWLLAEVGTANVNALYWAVLGCVVGVFLGLSLAANSRFGHALRGIRDNETRMQAMGFPTYRLKLCAFTGAGAIAGLSGALMALQTGFVSPASMHWTQSALLIVMVVIGGIGSRWGAIVGVAVWMLLEEFLQQYTEYWHLPLGLLLIAVVFGAPLGVASLWRRVK